MIDGNHALGTTPPPLLWKERSGRPNVRGVSVRSRDGAPSRKGSVVHGHITKASDIMSTPLPSTSPSLIFAVGCQQPPRSGDQRGRKRSRRRNFKGEEENRLLVSHAKTPYTRGAAVEEAILVR